MPKHDFYLVCVEWASLGIWIDLGCIDLRPREWMYNAWATDLCRDQMSQS